jgi:hypothetical protein
VNLIKWAHTLSVIKSFHYPTIEQMDWEADNPDASKQTKGDEK